MNDIFNRNNGSLFDENGNTNDAFLSLAQGTRMLGMETYADFEIIKEMVPNTLPMEIDYIFQSTDMTRQEQLKASKALIDEYMDNISRCEKIYSRRKTKNFLLSLLAMFGTAVILNTLGGQGTINGLTNLFPKHTIK